MSFKCYRSVIPGLYSLSGMVLKFGKVVYLMEIKYWRTDCGIIGQLITCNCCFNCFCYYNLHDTTFMLVDPDGCSSDFMSWQNAQMLLNNKEYGMVKRHDHTDLNFSYKFEEKCCKKW
jgi:hypothetical protein